MVAAAQRRKADLPPPWLSRDLHVPAETAESVASGWHLHQSIVSHSSGENAFMSQDAREALSPFGRGFLAGLLSHARASAVFTTPTINGYSAIAPIRWRRIARSGAATNRGVMIRVLGGRTIPRHVLRTASANPRPIPISYMASQILSGLDGVDRGLDPGPSADTPYETQAALLPKTLQEAVSALKADPFFRDALGAAFVDYYVHIKNAEIERFQSEVSEWEQREYFEMF